MDLTRKNEGLDCKNGVCVMGFEARRGGVGEGCKTDKGICNDARGFFNLM